MGGAQQSQAPLQKALLKVKTAAAEVGGPRGRGGARCAPGVKKCKNGCAVQPGGGDGAPPFTPGEEGGTQPGDMDNATPPGQGQ